MVTADRLGQLLRDGRPLCTVRTGEDPAEDLAREIALYRSLERQRSRTPAPDLDPATEAELRRRLEARPARRHRTA